MHPKKAEMLSRLDEVSQIHDAALRRSLDVVTNPAEFGWQRSLLTAAVVVPVTGVSAIVTDLSRALLARSDDSAWDRGSSPPEPPASSAPPEPEPSTPAVDPDPTTPP